MLIPRKNNFDLFDDFLNDDFFKKNERSLMKTDIREKKNKYLIDIDLPGFSKENINLSLNNGYLIVSAKTEQEKNEDNDEKYVCKERFFGECNRSFYVGDDIKEEDIEAEFKNGILKITVPKKETDEKGEIKQIEIK
jgi:HSP20 family molecular chaperone IbpA